ncbi:MAG: succinate dehydrogenase iron-sulfur subunit [Nitrospirota bacterium]|jgi:succinate dehydrogenase / fumarate reductase iron-sulfur subunit
MTRDYVFRIRRFDPEGEAVPRWQEYALSMEPGERVLDGLLRIKETLDGTLTFRRSCAHGICGSCAVMINGRNALACQSLLGDLPGRLTLEPLPALPLVKDLVVDMEPFFRLNELVMPYLINTEEPPERERLQAPGEQLKVLQSITCIMCSCCTSACPVYWSDREYLGPSALLKAYRFIFDSRDRAEGERLRKVANPRGLWRCHSIYNCVEACPKGIDVTRHITEMKRLAVRRRLRG